MITVTLLTPLVGALFLIGLDDLPRLRQLGRAARRTWGVFKRLFVLGGPQGRVRKRAYGAYRKRTGILIIMLTPLSPTITRLQRAGHHST